MKKISRSSSVPAIIRLSTFLKFVASGGYQLCVGNECVSFMSKSKVSELITECLDIMEQYLCPQWIVLEKSQEEEEKIKQSFFGSGGLPGVVGCIDGTHVRIKSPGINEQHLYYNRKGYYSINVMAVSFCNVIYSKKTDRTFFLQICDHNMVINFVDARHPGANHDAFVWDHSDAHDYFQQNYLRGKRNTWLLGMYTFYIVHR